MRIRIHIPRTLDEAVGMLLTLIFLIGSIFLTAWIFEDVKITTFTNILNIVVQIAFWIASPFLASFITNKLFPEKQTQEQTFVSSNFKTPQEASEKKYEPVQKKYDVLPAKGFSYVTGENGEPMLTYYRPNSGLFCSTPTYAEDPPYYLNIRRPIVLNIKDKMQIDIPTDLPDECDGIIFRNYGKFCITAFYVKNKSTQSMKA